ncbi:MAG: DHH family phosphoesterase [Caldilineales bacterium]
MEQADLRAQFGRAAELIAASRRPLLICHVAPDGDAIGSLLGLTWILRALGKEVTPASQDGVPRNLRFLPGSQGVVTQAAGPADLVIAIDSSDLERLGTVYDQPLLHSLPLLNIDHHVTNLMFGSLDVVVPAATSAAEVIYDLATSQGWPIPPHAAQCLLTGLVTDTRGFRTSNVSARTLEIAQKLMEAGGSLHAVTEGVLEQRSFDTVCLWGHALAAARLEDGIAWTAIPLTMRAPCNDVEQSDSGLANFMVAADEVEVAVVLVERKEGPIDVGFRSAGRVDVAQLALTLGAAGIRARRLHAAHAAPRGRDAGAARHAAALAAPPSQP